jgi:hypothetical protein
MQFADIKNDIAFRKIFGNENKKEILISFLKDLEAYQYSRMRETDEITREMFVIEKRNIEFAKSMLADNETNEKIAKYTGLTIEQIQELRIELNQ